MSNKIRIALISSLLIFLSFVFAVQAIGQQTLGLFEYTHEALNGYTLFTADTSTYLIDNCGRKIKSWESEFDPGLSVYLEEDGSLMRAGRLPLNTSGPGGGGLIEKFDWEGNLLWHFELKDSSGIQHHDIEPMPNGNVLAIVWEIKTREEANQAGTSIDKSYWSLAIKELQPINSDSAQVVWEWHAWDHLIQDFDNTQDNFGIVSDHPELIDINFMPPPNGTDWLHANSIDYNIERDEILISVRHFGEIFIVDHSTTTVEASMHGGGNRGRGGDILYRWGNAQAYGRGVPEDQKLFRQHDAKWIPSGYPNEGKISIFNNGAGRRPIDYTSIDIIEPPIDAGGNYILDSGNPFGPEELTWTYSENPPDDYFEINQGGAQILSNGNFLITKSSRGEFVELNSSGELVWRYVHPIGSQGPLSQGSFQSANVSTFRATRYSSDYPAFTGRPLIPGEPLELNPQPSDCVIFDGTTSLYLPLLEEEVYIYNNPAEDFITIRNLKNKRLQLEIFNIVGQNVLGISTSIDFDIVNLSSLNNGTYILRFIDSERHLSSTHKIIKIN